MRLLAITLLAVAVVSGQEIKKICEPGTVTKEDCNDCRCSADGTFRACTMMACPPQTRLPREAITEDGKISKINHQNSLEFPNGPLLIRQGRQVSHDRPCVPGKRFNIYCNTCTCGSDGFSVICTRMECDERIYNEDGSLKNIAEAPNNALLRQKRQISDETTCEPGKVFKDYCNTCKCGLDGVTRTCTMMLCDERIYNKDGSRKDVGEDQNNPLLRQKRQISHDRPCVPGTKFNIYCNTCACGSDGFSVICTRMECDERIYNEDGSLKNIAETPNNALLRQKRQISDETTCEPGKVFKDYCNTCKCGLDGVTRTCTMMLCDESIYNKDGSRKDVGADQNNPLLRQKRQISDETTCEPGKVFKDYCNTCKCGLDGVTRTCTMMLCDERIYNKDGSRKDVGQVENNPLLRQKRQISHDRPCVPGTKFNIFCNTCACGSDGFSVICTRMECDERIYNEDGSLKNIAEAPNNALLRQKRQISDETTCEPGKVFKDYCNTCKCGLDGVTRTCTMMLCDERIYNKDGSRKDVGEDQSNPLLRQKRQISDGTTCEPGKFFKDYCNTCKCGLDGVTRTCTIMACDKRIYNKDGSQKDLGEAQNNPLLRQKRQISHNRPCEAGTKFNIDCNTCFCGSDGFSVACTRKMCPKGTYNEDDSRKIVEEPPKNDLIRQKRQLSPGTTCEPGSTFKHYCNACTCGPDGVSAICTKMGCPKGMFNADGSPTNVAAPSDEVTNREKRQISYNRPCEAGKKFNIYCNNCTCGSDGFTVICTKRICNEDVYNEDGSLKNLPGIPHNPLLRQKRQFSNENKA